jgi:hypothetical protein
METTGGREDLKSLTRLRFVAALLRATGLIALVLTFSIPLAVPTQLRALDFAAFYCAGEAMVQHADPYRAMPLGACERRVSRNGPIAAGAVIPAPLPPYALAAFAPLSRLSFPLAQQVFDLLSIAAFAISALLLRSMTRRPVLVIAYALAPIAWVVLAMGQTVILMLAALVGTAFLLERGRDRLAALAACAMMLEPHLGLPVCLALFVCRPRTRLVLIAAAVLVVVFSLSVIPWSLSVEYVSQVLPLHAVSEARSATQISLTSILTFFGVSDHAAITLGGIQYAVTAAIAIGFARRIGSPAALAFIPALGALTGGSFLHGYDLLLAVPAALIFWDQRPMIAALAVVAVSPHGPEVGGMIAACTAIVSAAVLVAAASRGRYGAVAALSLAIVLITTRQPSGTTKKAAMTQPSPSSYAERSWSEWESHNVRSAQWLLTIVPSCTGTIALFVLAVRRRIRYGTLATMTNPASPSAFPG